VSAQVPARAGRLHELWRRLPTDPLTERELEAALVRLLDRPAAEADASAYMEMLLTAEAVKATGQQGRVVYVRSKEFPVFEEQTGPGSASYDAELRQMAAREQEQHDRNAEEVRRNSPANRQREELVALVNSLIDQRLGELRAEPPVVLQQRHHRDQELLRQRMRERLNKGNGAGEPAP